jgi:superfamily II DNA helicase RecQ
MVQLRSIAAEALKETFGKNAHEWQGTVGGRILAMDKMEGSGIPPTPFLVAAPTGFGKSAARDAVARVIVRGASLTTSPLLSLAADQRL